MQHKWQRCTTHKLPKLQIPFSNFQSRPPFPLSAYCDREVFQPKITEEIIFLHDILQWAGQIHTRLPSVWMLHRGTQVKIFENISIYLMFYWTIRWSQMEWGNSISSQKSLPAQIHSTFPPSLYSKRLPGENIIKPQKYPDTYSSCIKCSYFFHLHKGSSRNSSQN